MTLFHASVFLPWANRLTHGFTGKPLSLGGTSLTPEERQRNRLTLCQTHHLQGEKLIVPEQVHHHRIRTTEDSDFSQTDAVLVVTPQRPAMVLVADCVPIVLYDPVQHLGAVIHAGWRGTARSITSMVVERMITQHQSQAENMVAAIGPAIGRCCYDVSSDVVKALMQTLPTPKSPLSEELSPWLLSSTGSQPHTQRVDLQRVNQFQLMAMGVQTIEVLPYCTRCHPDQLWSHRRGDTNRQGAFLQLDP